MIPIAEQKHACIHDISGPFPPGKYRNLSLPAFACDPRTGQLYLTWSDKGVRDADILFTTSKDHGLTWSAPIRVNDDTIGNRANQFQPQMAVAPDGASFLRKTRKMGILWDTHILNALQSA